MPGLATTNGPATIVMLAKAFGGDIDNTEPAWERLPELADQLVTVYTRSSDLIALVQQEEVWVAPYSSFSIGNLLDTGLPLEMVIPSEGLPAAASVVSIVAGTEKSDLAHKYIDFLISRRCNRLWPKIWSTRPPTRRWLFRTKLRRCLRTVTK